ncbi:MAG TPA: glycosyltransferase family 2 protein, partial [bacterium]|nr:glycosyltransferase family 2 protein [bacterium]
MARTGDNLPIGFCGPVKGWRTLVPSAERRLTLPLAAQPPADADSAEGSHREAAFDLIEVTAFTESMGRVEDAFRRIAGQLRSGGTLLCDIDNVQSARMLRLVLEGRPGAFDPAGSTADPSQPLSLRRALHASAAAGLVVRDVLAVPSGADEFPRELAGKLLAVGMLPVQWLAGAPPSRYWLHCEKRAALAGSVLIAGGDDSARARTERAVRSYLPPDWEVVTATAESEGGQWNRAMATARGDVVWFLRAGMTPPQRTFERMSARAGIGPVVAVRDGEPVAPGDLAGRMMPRLDALLLGPINERYQNTCVALEDHVMRAEALLPKAWSVTVELDGPPPPIDCPEQLAAETEHLMHVWNALSNDPRADVAPQSEQACSTAGESSDVPPAAPWAGRAPRITLCMIARNEERFLATCLEHAAAAFDELVLVDTGSTDRTVEIAESFGAKVVHEPWADDFSAPRNTALQHATGDWILVLDADEFLLEEGPARIRELVQDPTALGYHMRFINDYGDGKTIGVMMVRLFRNLPGIAYQNVIHEQVTPSLQRIGGELGLTLRQCEVEVVHHGYSREVMDARSKNERNERLFLKQRELQPDDIYCAYKYGDFLRR